MTGHTAALDHLRVAAEHTQDAWRAGKQATVCLEGSRAARARELTAMLADAIVYAERLAVIVEGDMRAEVTR